MAEDDATRSSLKTELLRRVEVLGQQQALFPSKGELLDEIVQQLEEINPISHPLRLDNLPTLIGDWQLIYASRGTVVTRSFASFPDWAEIRIKHVWQSLIAGGNRKISASNGALLSPTIQFDTEQHKGSLSLFHCCSFKVPRKSFIFTIKT